MESISTGNNCPRVPLQQQQLSAFRHRILKLRWLGQEDEAGRLLRIEQSKDGSALIHAVELDAD
jgi:hypothetical protein